jgi:hypothetical protein
MPRHELTPDDRRRGQAKDVETRRARREEAEQTAREALADAISEAVEMRAFPSSSTRRKGRRQGAGAGRIPDLVSAGLRRGASGAKVDQPLRPFHDGPHTSITNAAAGVAPTGLKARAGHSDFKTPQGYIDLADEMFRNEAVLLEERLFGQKSGQK